MDYLKYGKIRKCYFISQKILWNISYKTANQILEYNRQRIK